MKKVNAFLGFTRIDQFDRINDVDHRLVKLTRKAGPTWLPATEDRGEGIFLICTTASDSEGPSAA
jgi:hypothetical protein